MIQLVVVLAVHAHELALAVRVTDDDPLGPEALTDDGEIVNVQGGGAAACDTVYVCPPTVTVAVRAVPVFAATVTTTVPVPVPLAGATVAQAAPLDAVQPHVDALAVTGTLNVPPVATTLPVDDDSVNVQGGGAAACDTVYVCPPTVTVAVRAVPVFAATVTTTVPVPVPLAGATVAQAAPLDAVQPHVDALAVTGTFSVPPVATTLPVDDDSVNVQGGGAAACDTVYVCPPTVTVAVRAVPVFAATVTTTVPVPVPLAGATVAQAAPLDAVQPHVDALAVTGTFSVPPVATTLPVDDDSVNVQGGGAAACDTVYVCPPTVTVAVRAVPVFAATVTTTVPVPVPLAGATVAQAAPLDAVQPHVDALAVTGTLNVPPVATTLPVDDDSVNVQGGGAAACDTVYVCPPTVTVAVRAVPVFAATVTTTVPVPVPLAGATVAQAAPLDAVQPHVDALAVTGTFSVPPVATTLPVDDDSVNVQGGGAAACDTVYVCPPTVTVAVRAVPVFAATVTTTVPVPVPLAGATVAQAAPLDAVQPHVDALAVTGTLNVPPVATTLPVDDDSVNVQGGGAAACDTVYVCPPTVTVAVRAVPVFAATVTTTVPVPVPLAGATIAQAAPLDAVQPHVDALAVTGTFSVPPVATTLPVDDDSVNVQGGGAAACDTVYVCPPTVTVAVRAVPVFAATVTTTVPVPVPLAGATVAQAAPLDAVQPHVDALAVTGTLNVPPVATTLPVDDDSVNVQGGGAAACDTVYVCPPTVTVAVRAVPVFAATVTTTVPVPVPLAGATVAQAAPLDAVQPHVDALAVTGTLNVPPVATTLPVDDDSVNVQGGGAAACDTVYVCPPTVTVAVRAVPVFAATVTTTVPVPVPLAGATVAQAAPLDAVQPHVDALAVTGTFSVPPVATTLPVDDDSVNVQGGGAAACDTVYVCPPTVTVAVRAVPVFAATVTATVPVPVPLAGATVAQAAPLDAVQPHVDALAVTGTLNVPPVATTLPVDDDSVNVQGGGVTD